MSTSSGGTGYAELGKILSLCLIIYIYIYIYIIRHNDNIFIWTFGLQPQILQEKEGNTNY